MHLRRQTWQNCTEYWGYVKNGRRTGMSDLTSTIIEWLERRPAWQQEAVNRQLEKGALNDSDIDEIASRLKSSTGSIPLTSPTFSALQSVGQTSEALRLVSIGDIQGIESLKPSRPLDFGEGNLSVNSTMTWLFPTKAKRENINRKLIFIMKWF